jgi:hypothetical protein
MSDIDCPDLKSANDAMYGEIQELRAHIARLRAALKPFAKVSGEWDDEDISLEVELRAYDDRPGPGVSVADFRNARAALAGKDTP